MARDQGLQGPYLPVEVGLGLREWRRTDLVDHLDRRSACARNVDLRCFVAFERGRVREVVVQSRTGGR